MGIWEAFVGVFVEALKVLATTVGVLGPHQWTVAIVLFTLIVRTVLIPVTVAQLRSARAMERLRPEMERIKRRYRKKPDRLQRELQKLYTRDGHNPLLGCVPQLAALPFLIGVYWAIRRITTPVSSGGLGVDVIPFLGLGNLANPALASVAGIMLIAVLAGALLWSVLRSPSGTGPRWVRFLTLGTAGFAAFLPGAVVLYWATGALYQAAQQTLLRT